MKFLLLLIAVLCAASDKKNVVSPCVRAGEFFFHFIKFQCNLEAAEQAHL